MFGLFFLYDLLYTSFSSFKTEYIYQKQDRKNWSRICANKHREKS